MSNEPSLETWAGTPAHIRPMTPVIPYTWDQQVNNMQPVATRIERWEEPIRKLEEQVKAQAEVIINLQAYVYKLAECHPGI